MLKDRWDTLTEDGKQIWKEWEVWDAKRYEHQLGIYQNSHGSQGSPKRAKIFEEISKKTGNNTVLDQITSKSAAGAFSIPKRRST
jgi:hypothetical protein